MFSVILGLPWLVVVSRFLLPLPWFWSAKIAIAVLLLVASQHLQINRLSSGSVFDPEYPRPLILAFNTLFGAMVLLAVFQLTLDAASLAIMLAQGRFPSVPAEIRYALGVVALGLSAYGVSQAVRVPPVKELDIAIAGLPPEFDGYRMLQLTDLHISRLFPAAWTQAVVSRANTLSPDLIVVTGDFIDGGLDERRADVAPLAGLRAADGVIAIPGNHEYYFDYADWMKHYRDIGMTVLENDHVVIRREDAGIVIAGVTDLSAARHGLRAPDLAAALRDAPDEAPVILLDHQPRQAAKAAAAGVALQLSGHTHGGMVIGLDRIVARANNGFVSGLYRIGGMQLYVNNGTGLWPGFALRLGVPSELTVLTLRRAG